MNTSPVRRLQLIHMQSRETSAHLPKMRKGQLKEMAAVVHAAAIGLPSNPLQRSLQQYALDRHHVSVLMNNGIRTLADLIGVLPEGGHCTNQAFLIAILTAARLLNLLPESATRQVTDTELKTIDNRFWRWLEQEPLPAALRSSAFLMVTKTRSGFIRYSGFRQAGELREALTTRCNFGALDSIVSILDLIHLQRVCAVADIQVGGPESQNG